MRRSKRGPYSYVAQRDLLTSDVLETCGEIGERYTFQELAAIRLAMEKIRRMIISMKQKNWDGSTADLSMATPSAKNRPRQAHYIRLIINCGNNK